MKFILPTALLLYFSVAHTDICQQSVTADMTTRSSLPQTLISKDHWQDYWGSWGPPPALYPAVQVPQDCDLGEWRRKRIRAVAENYIGLPYLHRHIPAAGGLDCSNFTAWVFNFGFGLKIDSNVHRQAETAGRKLAPTDKIMLGDLLFIWNRDKTEIGHVVIYLGDDTLIDSTGPGVQMRKYTGWYKERFAWARRIFD